MQTKNPIFFLSLFLFIIKNINQKYQGVEKGIDNLYQVPNFRNDLFYAEDLKQSPLINTSKCMKDVKLKWYITGQGR